MKKTIICLIGLGSFCAMLRAPFFGSLTTGAIPDPSLMRLVYDTAMIFLGIALIVIGFQRFGKRRTYLKGTVARYGIGGICAVLGLLAINTGRTFGVMHEGLYLVSIVFLCAGFASLLVGWFQVLVGFPRDQIAVLTMGAFVISHIFGIFDMVPRNQASWFSTLYPLISLLMLCAYPHKEDSASTVKLELISQNSYLKKVQLYTLVLIFAEILCGAFLRSRWAHGGINYNPHPSTIYAYLISIGIGVVFLIIAKRARTAAEGTLVIGGVGLIGFVLATIFNGLAPLWPFVTGLYSALVVYLVALIALWGIDYEKASTACAGLFLTMYGLASGITSSIVPAIMQHQNATPDEYLFLVGSASAFVISLGMCAILFATVITHRRLFLEVLGNGQIESDLQGVLQETPSQERNQSNSKAGFVPDLAMMQSEALQDDSAGPSISHERAIYEIAEKFSLTEREREAASLMARGYTIKRVAEELTVAPSTIKGYSKNIYRKIGIHSKDELIEAVNEVKYNS